MKLELEVAGTITQGAAKSQALQHCYLGIEAVVIQPSKRPSILVFLPYSAAAI